MRVSKASIHVLLATLAMIYSGPVDAEDGIPCDPEAISMPISFGDTVICDIDQAGDTDLFTFKGQAGDLVNIQATETAGTAGSDPCLELYFEGNFITFQCRERTPLLREFLDYTGTYTIVVSDENQDFLIDYTLSLERFFPLSCSTTSICSDCSVEGSIDPIGDFDFFAFSGVAGDSITVTVTETAGIDPAGPCLLFLFPDGVGTTTCDSDTATLTRTLNDTGIYKIGVTDGDDNATLDYELTVECTGSCENVPFQCADIFADGFEPGNTSAWSEVLPR